MAWYFTSDWHLNHSNIIKYCNRPFTSIEEKELIESAYKGLIPLKSIKISQESLDRMNNSIIEATNNVVCETDNLVILGDFCWTSTPKDQIRDLVSKLRCKNLYLIWGNHDNRQTFLPFFKATYDQYVFHIEGQHIFAMHYPCKSWYRSSYGSWMLYGHVHNQLCHQDNGLLSDTESSALKNALESLVGSSCPSIDESSINTAYNSISSIFRKKLFALDVGVDNQREGVPFGTPWSFSEIRCHMENKLLG
jgi:calcineurin-like phosphoesterase family protein